MLKPNHIILDVFNPRLIGSPYTHMGFYKPNIRSKFFFERYFMSPTTLFPNTHLQSQWVTTQWIERLGVYISLFKQKSVKGFTLNTRLELPFYTFDINFLRKERLYTKLKYSRSPAYDIVSGGFAALFAGLLGFLTSEKFGFELVDSGDFYYLFMYGVFTVFSLRPFITILDAGDNLLYTLFIRDWTKFYTTVMVSLMSTVKYMLQRFNW